MKANLKIFKLFCKNMLKNIWHVKIQFITVLILVILSCTIFTTISVASNRVSREYTSLADRSNLHNFIVDFNNVDYDNNPATSGVLDEDVVKQDALHQVAANLETASNPAFTVNRVETRIFTVDNSKKTIKVIGWNKEQTVDKLVIFDGKNLVPKTTPKTGTSPDPLYNYDVVFNKEFAERNNIHIGDVVRLQKDFYGSNILIKKDIPSLGYNQGNNLQAYYNWIKNSPYSQMSWYLVVGFGSSADMTTPIIDQTTIIPDKTNQGVAYVNASNFGLNYNKTNTANPSLPGFWTLNPAAQRLIPVTDFNKEIYYVGKFNTEFLKHTSIDQGVNSIETQLQAGVKFKIDQSDPAPFDFKFFQTQNKDLNFVFNRTDQNYRFYNRANLLPNTIYAFQITSWAVFLAVLIVAVLALVMVIQKIIRNSSTQLGINKALGYSTTKLLLPYCSYPLLFAILGGILGYAIGIGLQSLSITLFANYFNINFGGFIFDWRSLFFSVLGLIGFLTIVTFLVAFLILKQKPNVLIWNIDALNPPTSRVKILFKKLAAKTSFGNRIKISFFSSSFGKIGLVFSTMLIGTILITLSAVSFKIVHDNKKYTYYGLNYQNKTELRLPEWNNPLSFYKTYDPNTPEWQASQAQGQDYFTGSVNEIVNSMLNNKLNRAWYNPNINVQKKDLLNTSLQNLSWKNFDKNFFTNDSQYNSAYNPFTPAMASLSWPDYKALVDQTAKDKTLEGFMPNYSVQGPTPDTDKLNYPQTTKTALAKMQAYAVLRAFYMKYRTTINMSFNPLLFKDDKNIVFTSGTGEIKSDMLNLAKDPYFIYQANSTAQNPTIENFFVQDFHLTGPMDDFILKHPALEQKDGKWIGTFDPYARYMDSAIEDMVNWFGLSFYLRGTNSIVQGIYSRAPYFVRQSMQTAFANKNKQYNISFNIAPFDPSQEVLGTYVPVTKGNANFDLFGLTQNQNMINLYTKNQTKLNSKLFENTDSQSIPLILNKTAATKLHLALGQTVALNVLRPELKGTVKTADGEATFGSKDDSDLAKWDFAATQNPSATGYGAQSANMQQATYDKATLYKPGPLGQAPSNMMNSVVSNKVQKQNTVVATNFKLVGISNNYGPEKGYIANQKSNQLMWYDKTKAQLYQIFRTNWTNYSQLKGATALTEQVKEILNTISNNRTYQALRQQVQNNAQGAVLANNMFNNAWPVFNYILSQDKATNFDYGNNTSQPYGDFTLLGLNGGPYTNNNVTTNYPVLGQIASNKLDNRVQGNIILNQITALVNYIMIIIGIIAVLVSFTIIVLSTSLIISENKIYIGVLKTLGYNGWEITRFITGMYSPLILIAFAAGFPSGWFIIQALLGYIANHSIWVLPLFFVWWLPFAIAAMLFSVYVITFVVNWFQLNNTKVIDIIKPVN